MKSIAFLLLMFFILASCAPADSELQPSDKIGAYRSPFADGKFKLNKPSVTKVVSKSNQKIVSKFRAFNPNEDAIYSSVLINATCAQTECRSRTDANSGRLSCFAARKMEKENWPAQVNRYSFTFKFPVGESLDDIESAFESDVIDQKCVVGISNYGEFKLAEINRITNLNDPDIQLAKPSYQASPYLDQIGFFDSLDFINSLQPTLTKIRVGVIDADFVKYYDDLGSQVFDYEHSKFEKTYPIVGNGIINVGGAPIQDYCTSACHGSYVSQLILGHNGNSKQGAGIIGGPKSGGGDAKIVALSVYAIDPVTGEKYISVDHVNNALALLVSKKVDVINISLGYDASPAQPPLSLLTSILSAIGSGSVVVVAAGNRSTNLSTGKDALGADVSLLTYPAVWGYDYLGLISVGSTNKSGLTLATFSNYGPKSVDILAPGDQLVIGGKTMSGTSFSAPLVTSAAALVKAYYLSKLGDAGLISPAQVETGLLDGARSEPALVEFVENGKMLDLKSISTFIQSSALAELPKAVLDTDGFWYTRDGTSMQYSIRTKTSGIKDNATDIFIGIWEKLDMSLPPLAQFEAANGIQNFSLPYHQFLVGDEGFWVVVYRKNSKGTRIPISSKLYKFTDLVTTPTQNNTDVIGAINQINTDVSGWACLPGRPDRLKIEVRSQSPTGPTVASQITSHQPKGRVYFDDCTPFTVLLGFQFPLPAFLKNTDYYFVAVHPTVQSKNKVLNATAFRIEDTQYSDPVVHDLKKKIDAQNVELSGRVCWVDQLSPGIISNQLSPFISESNPVVMKWLETMLGNVQGLKDQYGQTFQNSAGQLQKRFFLFSDWLGLYSKAWSTVGGTTPIEPVAKVSEFDKPFFIQSIPLKDSLLDTGGYGIVPILYWNDPNNLVDGTLYQTPAFKDKSQPDFVREPESSLADRGSAWTREENGAYSYSKRWNSGLYQAFAPASNSTVRAAWDNPVNHYGSQMTSENDDTACSVINKVGVGQKFKVIYSRAALAEEFFLGKSLLNSLNEKTFSGIANQDQLNQWFTQYNAIYQQAVVSDGTNLLKSIVDQGEMTIGLRFLSPAAGMTYQKIKVKDLPNQ